MPFRPRPLVAVMLAASITLPLLAASQFIAHTRRDERDGWLYAYYGRQIAAGRSLYVDLVDNKPPGIYWLNAAGARLSSDSQAGVIGLCALATALTCLGAFAAVRRLTDSWVAAGAACVFVALYVQHGLYHVGANRPGTFIVAAEMWAVFFYLRAVNGERRWASTTLAGVFSGLALLFKQTALAVPIAIGVHQLVLLLRRSQDWRRSVAMMTLGVVGFALPVGVGILLLDRTSNLEAAYRSVIGLPGSYFQPGEVKNWWPRWLDVGPHVDLLALPLILCAGTLICAIGNRKGLESPHAVARAVPSAEILLVAWFVAALYLAAVAPDRKAHYFGPALPPLVILATYGLGRMIDAMRGVGWKRYHVWVAVLWVLYMIATPLQGQFQRVTACYHWTYVDPPPDRLASTVTVIQAHTEPSDPIFVTGFRPELYYRADRPPACRYIGTSPASLLRDTGQPIADEIVASLIAYPPKVIVADRRAVETMTLSRSDSSPNELDFAGLVELLHQRYRPDETEPSVWIRH